jgi:hypothetical protein
MGKTPVYNPRALSGAVQYSLWMQSRGLPAKLANRRAGFQYGFTGETVARHIEEAKAWMKGKGEPPEEKEAQ